MSLFESHDWFESCLLIQNACRELIIIKAAFAFVVQFFSATGFSLSLLLIIAEHIYDHILSGVTDW